MLPTLVACAPGRLRHLPPAISLLALAALLLGLGRPQAALTVDRQEATVIVAIDTSGSMAATDVRPTRLAVAEAAARAFVAGVPASYRVGVVAFANGARVVAPATTDRSLALRALAGLRPGTATTIGDAIERSIAAGELLPAGGRRGARRLPLAVLLLSDGAQTAGRLSPLQAARRARARGVRVSTVVLGTAAGIVRLPLPGGFVERVLVPADPATLRRIAAVTGGRFYPVPDPEQFRSVYQQLGSRVAAGSRRRELTDLFAGTGGLLFLIGAGLSALWFQRVA